MLAVTVPPVKPTSEIPATTAAIIMFAITPLKNRMFNFMIAISRIILFGRERRYEENPPAKRNDGRIAWYLVEFLFKT